MLVAGLFLREFVPDGVRWAHLDIAGPAFHKGEPYGYTPKGGTGRRAAVRCPDVADRRRCGRTASCSGQIDAGMRDRAVQSGGTIKE